MKRRFGIIALWLIFAVLGFSPRLSLADPAAAKQHLRDGVKAFVFRQYDQAVKEFEQGYREAPESVFHYNLGRSHQQARRPLEAARYFHLYLNAVPFSPDRVRLEKLIEDLERPPWWRRWDIWTGAAAGVVATVVIGGAFGAIRSETQLDRVCP